jgi:flavorubredoxin
MEIIRDFETLNPDGLEGEALVVFRPGISLFQEDMTNAFVEGLVEKDWIVNITTSSSQTPINIHDYDLLVLGTPTY